MLSKRTMNNSTRKKCTLLIPDFLFPLYEELRNQHGNLKKFSRFLLKRYYQYKRQFIFAKGLNATINYQENGLNLHREDFRPFEQDWVELKLLAASHNLSICAFFVLLLRLELAGALAGDEFGEVPPIFPKISLHQSITRYSIPIFTRILHLRV